MKNQQLAVERLNMPIIASTINTHQLSTTILGGNNAADIFSNRSVKLETIFGIPTLRRYDIYSSEDLYHCKDFSPVINNKFPNSEHINWEASSLSEYQ